MTTHTKRTYQHDSDLYAMQALIAESIAHAGQCGYLHIGDVPHRLFNGLRRDDPSELVWLWHDTNNTLVGFVIIFPADDGFDIQVHHAHRGSNLEREMIALAITETQKALKARDRDGYVGTDVDECDTTRIQMLEAAGLTRGDHLYWLTERDLSIPIPAPKLPQGFSIRSAAGVHEAQKLIDVHSGGFGSTWTLAQYERVMTSPGYDAERELVVVAPDGRFAAFCIIWLDERNKIGYFEPVGVHTDFHRRGLASALMNHAMHLMIDKGMQTATVMHEVDNPASTGLYASLGFKQLYKIIDYTLTQ